MTFYRQQPQHPDGEGGDQLPVQLEQVLIAEAGQSLPLQFRILVIHSSPMGLNVVRWQPANGQRHPPGCTLARHGRPIRQLAMMVHGSIGSSTKLLTSSLNSKPRRESVPCSRSVLAQRCARSTTSESPDLPGLIQLGPYIASGTLCHMTTVIPGSRHRYSAWRCARKTIAQ
jgi:hypothetical protein